MSEFVRLEFSESQQCFHVVDYEKENTYPKGWKVISKKCNEYDVDVFTSLYYDLFENKHFTYEEIKDKWKLLYE